MNLKGKMRRGSLFLSSGGSGGNKRKSSVGVAGVARVATEAGVAEVVDGIGVGSVVQTGVGDGGSGNDGSSDERCRDRELVDGGGGLLGGKTSGSGVIESSLEGSLGSGDILDVIEV